MVFTGNFMHPPNVDAALRLAQGIFPRVVREIPDAGWRPVRSRLTTREWEIVEHLSEGKSTQHIADGLVLSPKTVYSHVKSVMRKLGVHSRAEVVYAAGKLGLLDQH